MTSQTHLKDNNKNPTCKTLTHTTQQIRKGTSTATSAKTVAHRVWVYSRAVFEKTPTTADESESHKKIPAWGKA